MQANRGKSDVLCCKKRYCLYRYYGYLEIAISKFCLKVNSIDKIVTLTLLVNVEMIEENLVSTAVFIYNAIVFSPVFYSKKAS